MSSWRWETVGVEFLTFGDGSSCEFLTLGDSRSFELMTLDATGGFNS